MSARGAVSGSLAVGVLVTLAASCTAILGIDGDYDLVCTQVSECPEAGEACHVAACIQGICGEVVEADGASCAGGLTCNAGECCLVDDTCVDAVDSGRVPCPGTEARGQYDAFTECMTSGDCYDGCTDDVCLEDCCAPACPGLSD